MTEILRATLPGDGKANDPNDHRDDPDYLAKATDPFAWAGEFTLSDDDIAELKDPEWIIDNLVLRGHLVIVVAEPNGGKTTIFSHLAGQMVEKGFRVFYVNADLSGSDAAHFIDQSKCGGWLAMLPDLRPGQSMADVVENLKKMNDSGASLSDAVFIFDTFKKMTDVISKRQVKGLLHLLRSMTGKGATIILLGHTNKYKAEDGKPIFEGTGDVRSDADELIYLIPQKHPDRSMTVSTEPDKVRGSFEPITFEISADRRVSLADAYVDTAARKKAREDYENDQPVIEVIQQGMAEGMIKQSEIVERCKAHRIGRPTAIRVLKTYSKGEYQQWDAQKGFEHNVIQYFPVDK